MSEEWKLSVLIHPILQTITPRPNNSFEQRSYFKSNDNIRVSPPSLERLRTEELQKRSAMSAVSLKAFRADTFW